MPIFLGIYFVMQTVTEYKSNHTTNHQQLQKHDLFFVKTRWCNGPDLVSIKILSQQKKIMYRIIKTPLQRIYWFSILLLGFLFLASCSTTEQATQSDTDQNEVVPENNPSNNVSTNYDFTPGGRVLFEDDFSDTPIGDFPHRLSFSNGTMEVADWNGQKILQLQEGCQFEIPLEETLPERFTLEFDIHDSKSTVDTGWTAIYFAPPAANGFYPNRPGGPPFLRFAHFFGSGLHATNSEQISGVYNGGGTGNTHPALDEGLMHVEVQVDGEAIKVYVNQDRIVNVPNAVLGRHNAITVLCDAKTDPTYIDNIRLAAGGVDLYSSLESEGRVAARGILFDTGSDRIQSGSTATLEEILGMLRQYQDLGLRIEGHTDNTGDDASNKTLSQSRAEAVRDYLVEQGIDASRLEAVGLGEEQPVADNNT